MFTIFPGDLITSFSSQNVYELVVRHFLACVSQPAVGAETTVEINIAGEWFSASGRVILAVSSQNFLFQFGWLFVALMSWNLNRK